MAEVLKALEGLTHPGTTNLGGRTAIVASPGNSKEDSERIAVEGVSPSGDVVDA
jgi:hypothetical protein